MLNILSNFQPFTNNLIEYYNINDVRVFAEFDAEVFNDTIIIIEPFIIKDNYYSIHKVWQRYLKQEHPKTKLLVLGLRDCKNPNYIDFLNFPEVIDDKIQYAKEAKDNIILPIDGEDVYEIIRFLFEGHNNDGLSDIIMMLKPSVDALYKNYSQETLTSFLSDLNSFFERWEKVETFFIYLPFFPLIKDIDFKMKEVENYFTIDEHQFKKAELINIVDDVNLCMRKLKGIEKKYFTQENQ